METDLSKKLKDKIRSEGPITFRDYMAFALYDEHQGFYARGPAIGSPEGPFNTNANFRAFGYGIAQAIEQAEAFIGVPLRIVEFGGGTGQLGQNILSFLHRPHEYFVVETSPGLRTCQEQKGLCTISNITALTPSPTFVFGNEVLDALPVHRVMGLENGALAELYVDVDQDGEFVEQPGSLSTLKLAERLTSEGIQLGRGQVGEICLEITSFLQMAGQVLEPGYMVFIDYGDWATNIYSHRHRNGTLRSYFQQHQIHDPFYAIGQQDLTADVDYTAVISVAEELGFAVNGPLSQGAWLKNLDSLSDRGRVSHEGRNQAEVDMLTKSSGLGSAFDVLIFRTRGLPDGPGFHSRS